MNYDSSSCKIHHAYFLTKKWDEEWVFGGEETLDHQLFGFSVIQIET